MICIFENTIQMSVVTCHHLQCPRWNVCRPVWEGLAWIDGQYEWIQGSMFGAVKKLSRGTGLMKSWMGKPMAKLDWNPEVDSFHISCVMRKASPAPLIPHPSNTWPFRTDPWWHMVG